jgi:hypothetical protein
MNPKTRPSPYPFWLQARNFLEVAELAFGELRGGVGVENRGLVPYYNLAMAIELGFKAFLIAKGYSLDVLRSKKKGFGHNLVALLEASQSNGLEQLDGFRAGSLDDLVALLSEDHEQRRLGYPESGRMHKLPRADQALHWVRCMLEAVLPVCEPARRTS